MNTVEPHIKNYINASIDAVEVRWDKKIDQSIQRVKQEISIEIKEYKVELKQHMTDLRDGFRQEIKMGFEAADGHMRVIAMETTSEAIRKEVPGIVRKELMMFLTPR